ncbi:NAD(P)H-dependent oxidoreductase [Roseospira visakhapatnamensis]|uniref:Modulator of drug activity B n=1 Tax=Roseospira visakhapatnamensis TaxID=390880 RepID=A0A7W6RC55_9PROT|nr:NAD(P)H-dependent oxidoreductase [Roseospira visakhapatnamensis]MBB4265732.1 modulator of drug activity B [Roseospira visakhapatnamensis]
MSRILILNGHQPYPFSKGALNATLVERARDALSALGHEVRVTRVAEGYDVEQEIDTHVWADTVILQFPVNWMGVPWPLKRYMDEVYTTGMDGRLATGDGRRADAPTANYGMGGALDGTTYMLSVTFNAPREAFDNPAEPFFAGGGVDDLLRPVHLTARFLAMAPLPTFAAFDVMKNPRIEADLARFDAHLTAVFATETGHAAA